MNIELNLDNKLEAQKQVKIIQKSIDDLLAVCDDQNKQLKDNVKKFEQFEKTHEDLIQSAITLTEALKNIHIVLGSKKEVLDNDKDLNEIYNSLSTFVTGSGAIKLGVLKNAKRNDK